MKNLIDIPREGHRDKVILIGRGSSVDKLDVEAIKNQNEFDVCTISDAIKLTKGYTKFSFHFHWQSMDRCSNFLKSAKYTLVNTLALERIKQREVSHKLLRKIQELPNLYSFAGNRIVDLDEIEDGDFPFVVEGNVLPHHGGSVSGIFVFLADYIQYKEIHHIGFDGGMGKNPNFGKIVWSGRSDQKIEWAWEKYKEGWKTVNLMSKKYFPHVVFKPLKRFIKK